MKATLLSLSAFFLSFTLTSCGDSNCTNTNPVFDKFLPETSEYKDELAKELKGADRSELDYFVEKYVEKDASQQLYITIKGENLCATGILHVGNAGSEMDGIREAKGGGYRFTELRNLTFEIDQNELIYTDLGYIID